MRRFAQDTQVAIERSREQINTLIRRWGGKGVQWTDEWEHDRLTLVFKFLSDDGQRSYLARFKVHIETQGDIRQRCMGARGLREAMYEKELDRRGRREHRVLHLLLKACFEAIEEGILLPEQVFLPFLVDRTGQTIYEYASKNLTAESFSCAGLLGA